VDVYCSAKENHFLFFLIWTRNGRGRKTKCCDDRIEWATLTRRYWEGSYMGYNAIPIPSNNTGAQEPNGPPSIFGFGFGFCRGRLLRIACRLRQLSTGESSTVLSDWFPSQPPVYPDLSLLSLSVSLYTCTLAAHGFGSLSLSLCSERCLVGAPSCCFLVYACHCRPTITAEKTYLSKTYPLRARLLPIRRPGQDRVTAF
jgi:hypothetical protein